MTPGFCFLLTIEGNSAQLAAMASTGQKKNDHYARVATSLGNAWVGFNSHGITMVSLGEEPSAFLSLYAHRYGRVPQPGKAPDPYSRAITNAADGNGFDAPLDLSGLSTFERKSLLLLKRIPRGEVRTYSWLAREAGSPRAARAVGNAMARNPLPLLLPCHRVVPMNGGVGNYAFGATLKRELLSREGVALAKAGRR
jgi:O-6-methylguanine DNA methyltransferase